MSGKNDTPVLLAALVLTVALLSGGVWWLTRQFGDRTTGILPSTLPGSPTVPSSPASTAGSFADVQGVPTGLFTYGGSTTWAPIRGQIDPLIQQAHPSFQLRYTNPPQRPPDSGTGIQMLIDNQLSFAQSSRSLTPEELQAAQQRGISLREIPVALEGIAIAVHPGLNIPGLTIDQTRGIYTGQITHWSQDGGPNLTITPFSRSEDGGTVEFFLSNVLGKAPFSSSVRTIATTTEALRAVSTTPGSIYFASAPEVVGQCTVKPMPIGQTANQLVPPYQPPFVPPEQCPAQRNQINAAALQSGEYPITRRLLVIVNGNGQIDQQTGEAYANLLLSQQGQELLSQSGFVGIR